MRKLKMDLATLAVESFSTELATPSEGTVFGYSGGSCNTYDEATCGYNYCQVLITLPECPGTNATVVYWIAPPDDEASSCCTLSGCPSDVHTFVCGTNP